MSTKYTPGGQHPLQGAPQAQTEYAYSDAQVRAKEREVQPLGDVGTPQPLSAPEESARSRDVGFGPRLVVLNHFVTGPAPVQEGGDRPAFTRGRVIWASQLVGDEITQKAIDGDFQARATLRRYIEQGAVREATRKEARFTQITFLEGEQAIAEDLQQTQARYAQVEDENTRMKRLLDAINIDPNASPEEVQRQLSMRARANVTGTSQGQQQSGPQTPPSQLNASDEGSQTPPVSSPKEETGTGTGVTGGASAEF
jgi:hypothetical protein